MTLLAQLKALVSDSELLAREKQLTDEQRLTWLGAEVQKIIARPRGRPRANEARDERIVRWLDAVKAFGEGPAFARTTLTERNVYTFIGGHMGMSPEAVRKAESDYRKRHPESEEDFSPIPGYDFDE